MQDCFEKILSNEKNENSFKNLFIELYLVTNISFELVFFGQEWLGMHNPVSVKKKKKKKKQYSFIDKKSVKCDINFT